MKTIYLYLMSFMLLSMSATAQLGITVYDVNKTDSPALGSYSNSHPCMFTEFKGKLYFLANDSIHGYELHVMDSNSAPAMVADINPGTGNGTYTKSGVREQTRKMTSAKDANNKEWLFFGGWDNTNQGMALYKYSGSGAPVLAKRVTPGANTTVFNDLLTLDNEVYFYVSQNGYYGYYKYNPINDSLIKIPMPANVGGEIAVYNNVLYLSTQSQTNAELWEYTAATNTVRLVKDYPTSSRITEMQVAGGELFFMTSRKELYHYDPNAPLNDPSILDQYCYDNSKADKHSWLMDVYKDKLVYPCTRAANCVTCIYDPATKQTQVLTAGLWPADFEQHKDFLYFSAGNNQNDKLDTIGVELWEYRGGTDTPRMVANIAHYSVNKFMYSSGPLYITSYADGIYFRATKWYNNYTVGREVVKYVPQKITSVKEHVATQNKNDITLHPNPAFNVLHIATSEAYTQGRIYNSMGQMVKLVNANSKQVNISQLPAGNYYLQLSTNDKTMSKRFTVVR